MRISAALRWEYNTETDKERKKNMKKLISLLLAITMLCACLAGCGKGGETTAGAGSSGSEAQTQGAGSGGNAEAVEIVLWHTLTDHHQEALNKIIDGFNASQDAYVVTAQQQPYAEYDAKLLQAVGAGTGPDFTTMFPSTAINYITDGYLYDLGEFINDPEIGIPDFKDRIAAGMYAEITQWGDDGIYLLPTTFGSEVLYYNKTMLDELKLAPPATWEELEACAKAIYERYGIAGFGTDSITDTFQDWMMQGGSGYIDVENKEVVIDRELAIEKLNWFADAIKQGHFRLVGEDNYFSNPFGSQAVGMYVGSSAGVDYVYAAVPAEGEGAFEVGCCPIPQGDTKFIPNWGSTYACLSKDGEHARGVYEFLKYMTKKEQLVDWAIAFGALPAHKDSVEDAKFQEYAETNIAIKALVEEYDYVGHLPSIFGADTVRTEIDKMVQSVALGTMDAETAFDAFIAAANAALNDY